MNDDNECERAIMTLKAAVDHLFKKNWSIERARACLNISRRGVDPQDIFEDVATLSEKFVELAAQSDRRQVEEPAEWTYVIKSLRNAKEDRLRKRTKDAAKLAKFATMVREAEAEYYRAAKTRDGEYMSHANYKEARVRLKKIIERMSARDVRVVVLYCTESKTFDEIGKELNVCAERVRQLHKMALSRMQGALKGLHLELDEFEELLRELLPHGSGEEDRDPMRQPGQVIETKVLRDT
jgi:RNA polymerase sigma factor (sigma-70 family)